MNAIRIAKAAPLPILVMVGVTACQGIDKPQMAEPAMEKPAATPAMEWPAKSYKDLVGGWKLTDDEGNTCLLILGAAAASENTLGAKGTACPVKIAQWSYEAPNIHLYADNSKALGTLRADATNPSFAGELRVSGNRKKVRLEQAKKSAN